MYYFSSDIIFGLLLWTFGDYFLVTVLGGYAFESVKKLYLVAHKIG